jgi:choline dehydrogenase-like flavoprotein
LLDDAKPVPAVGVDESEGGGYHHMGTTRMGRTPAEGVVDADCRVFGVDNLYIAGSSVFSTGGHANPTLSIVQLALRLGEHLDRKLKA